MHLKHSACQPLRILMQPNRSSADRGHRRCLYKPGIKDQRLPGPNEFGMSCRVAPAYVYDDALVLLILSGCRCARFSAHDCAIQTGVQASITFDSLLRPARLPVYMIVLLSGVQACSCQQGSALLRRGPRCRAQGSHSPGCSGSLHSSRICCSAAKNTHRGLSGKQRPSRR